jgi:hypothetical protein
VAEIQYAHDLLQFGRLDVIGLGDIDGDGLNDFCANGWWGASSFVDYLRIMAGSTNYVVNVDPIQDADNMEDLIAVHPNPFRSFICIDMKVPNTPSFTMSIADISGRHIRDFTVDRSGFAQVSITWDGTDEAGSIVPPGAYYCYSRHDGRRSGKLIFKY